MPIPSPPTLGYSFTTFSSTNPTGQQPGDHLDAEFNRVYNSLSALISALNVSLNADGSLQSDAVQDAVDDLSPSPPDGINIWDVPSANSAVLAQAWAEHMTGPIPVEYLAFGGIDGTHWSAAWYADRAALILSELEQTLEDFLANFNWPIASHTTLGGIKIGDGLTADITGLTSVNFGITAHTAAEGNDARITGAEQRSQKGVNGGYAPLGNNGLIPTQYFSAGGQTTLPIAAISPARLGVVIPRNGFAIDSLGHLDIVYGSTINTAAQGNDARIVGAEQAANKAQPSGYASLDVDGKIPTSQLPPLVGSALVPVPPDTIFGNLSSSAAVPGPVSLTDALDDSFGGSRGGLLYRSAVRWRALDAGIDGYILMTNGPGADPEWIPLPAGALSAIAPDNFLANITTSSAVPVATTLTALLDKVLGSGRGGVIYRGASVWSRLGPGNSGQLLQTGGISADPSWVDAPSGGGGLSSIADARVLANVSGSSAVPSATTLSALLDATLSSTQGVVAYRNATVWTTLSPGTSGQILQTGGAAANPSWVDAPSGGGGLSSIATARVLANVSGSSAVPSATTISALLDATLSSTQGVIVYRGASAWSALTPGTSGQFLKTGGAAANPSWEDAPSGGGSSVNDFDSYAPVGGYQASRFYSPAGISTTGGVGSSADWLYAFSIFVPDTCSLKTLSVSLYGTNSGTARVRLGIYTDNAGGPDTLVVETGEFTTTSSVTAMTSPTLNSGAGQTLTRGRYWVAATHNGLGGMNSIGVDTTKYNVAEGLLVGASTAAGAVGQDSSATWIYAYGRSYAAMPSSWGSTARVQWNSFAIPILGF